PPSVCGKGGGSVTILRGLLDASRRLPRFRKRHESQDELDLRVHTPLAPALATEGVVKTFR
ncbi:MAG: hypothetical protein LBE08_08005, partial [Bifidobacteriaceae bacterium]|nr:hypothetical protein [Bifidobacteriaceae bacterium]